MSHIVPCRPNGDDLFLFVFVRNPFIVSKEEEEKEEEEVINYRRGQSTTALLIQYFHHFSPSRWKGIIRHHRCIIRKTFIVLIDGCSASSNR